MQRRSIHKIAAIAALAALSCGSAFAQDKPFKIGLLLPMSGQFATTGLQLEAGVRLYMAQNGVNVAGRKIEVILKDDLGTPDTTKRLAQELINNDKVDVLAGFGLTPLAFAVAPLATQSKTPMVVMLAGTSSITEASPYIIRTSNTLPQTTAPLADWAPKNGIKKVVTLVSDYGPGIDSEKTFKERFTANGGQMLGELRIPLRNPDFAPFLQKVRDLKPDALFVFVPTGTGTLLLKQFQERGLDKAGIKLIGDGSITMDDVINDTGDFGLGIVTSHIYSTSHPSAMNKKFVAAFEAANKGLRPNFLAVSSFDGMRIIYEALKSTKGAGGGDALMAGMKGQIFESPRGQIYIDAQTRDIVQDVYIRRVEKVNGQYYNTEFDVIKSFKDPGKTK